MLTYFSCKDEHGGATSVQTGAGDNKVVVFRVGREEYAVTIAAVKEVVPWTPPTPVPEAPPMVEGVVKLRGDIFPVIDLGKLFRTLRLKQPEESKTIVLEVDGHQAGFVVDDVTEVYSVNGEEVSKPSPVLRTGSTASAMVSGIIKMGENRLVVLVDASRILANARGIAQP